MKFPPVHRKKCTQKKKRSKHLNAIVRAFTIIVIFYETHPGVPYLSMTSTSMSFPLMLDSVVLNEAYSQAYFFCLGITGNKLK